MDAEGEFIDDPLELLEQSLTYKIIIKSAILQDGFCSDVFVRIPFLDNKYQTTEVFNIFYKFINYF